MKRVLFVDDEPAVLDGLRDLLRRHRRRWDMAFAGGGEAALAELAARPADVVVSDMRMPGMDGAELLRRVKAEHPRAVRLILTGHAEREAIFRALPVAHQFLSKPCDPEALANTIERACELQALVHDEALARVLGGIDSLPSPPGCYWKITHALADPAVSLQQVGAILLEDPVACAKLLQLVNSAYFGLAKPVADVLHAVSLLGLEMVRSLILTAHLLRATEHAPAVPGFSYQHLHASALLTAKVARRMMAGGPLAQACFTAGLLHDIGKVVIAMCFPEKFALLIAAAAGEPDFSVAREKDLLGFTHAEVGAYLLGLWGLPAPIVEAAAYHHEPARVAQRGFEVVGCVYVADALLRRSVPPTPGVSDDGAPLDEEYLASLGVADRLPEWRAIAAEEARAWGSPL